MIALFCAAAAGLVSIPYYLSYVAPWRQPVLTVHETVYDMRYFVKLLRLYNPRPNLDAAVPMEVLTSIQNAELVRREALRRGIRVSSDEVTETVKSRAAPSASDARESQDQHLALLARTGFSDAEFRALVETDLLQEKLREALGEELPGTIRQVHVQAIRVETADRAEEVRSRVAGGEEFADVAREESLDPESKENGGDLGWWPKGVKQTMLRAHLRTLGVMTATEAEAKSAREKLERGADFALVAAEMSHHPRSRTAGGDLGWVAPGDLDARLDAAVFGLEPGALSQPIATPDGYWIVKVVERAPAGNLIDDVAFSLPVGELSPPLLSSDGYYVIRVVESPVEREITASQREPLKDRAFRTWIEETARRGAREGWIQWHWDSDRYAWAAEQLSERSDM